MRYQEMNDGGNDIFRQSIRSSLSEGPPIGQGQPPQYLNRAAPRESPMTPVEATVSTIQAAAAKKAEEDGRRWMESQMAGAEVVRPADPVESPMVPVELAVNPAPAPAAGAGGGVDGFAALPEELDIRVVSASSGARLGEARVLSGCTVKELLNAIAARARLPIAEVLLVHRRSLLTDPHARPLGDDVWYEETGPITVQLARGASSMLVDQPTVKPSAAPDPIVGTAATVSVLSVEGRKPLAQLQVPQMCTTAELREAVFRETGIVPLQMLLTFGSIVLVDPEERPFEDEDESQLSITLTACVPFAEELDLLYEQAHGRWTNKEGGLLNFSDGSLRAGSLSPIRREEVLMVAVTDRRVKELYLGGNSLGDAGTRVLAEALLLGTALRSLMLDDNEIGEDGATRLADAIGKVGSLCCLSIGGNVLGGGNGRLEEAAEKVTQQGREFSVVGIAPAVSPIVAVSPIAAVPNLLDGLSLAPAPVAAAAVPNLLDGSPVAAAGTADWPEADEVEFGS